MYFLLILNILGLGNTTIQSFQQAKKHLVALYVEHPFTFYCGCRFTGKDIDAHSCGFKPPYRSKRAYKVEWEHIVPAHAFGKTFTEWTVGNTSCQQKRGKTFKGRHCAAKTSETFRFIEADMYNLVPAVGLLNQMREDFKMGIIPGEQRDFGACDFEVSNGIVEPKEDIRGDIARTYFYMAEAYPTHVQLSVQQKNLFKQWDKQDRVDAWECEKSRRIANIQGNVNSVVEKQCRK